MKTPNLVGERPKYRVTIRERIRVWYQNWKVRKVSRAVRVLSKALQDDPGFARSWHANIAMLICDYNKQKRCNCHCETHADSCPEWSGATVEIIHCNATADMLMRNLFGVKIHDEP